MNAKQAPIPSAKVVTMTTSNDAEKIANEEINLQTRLAEIAKIKENAKKEKELARLAKIDAANEEIVDLKADCRDYRQKLVEAKVAKNDYDETLYKGLLEDATLRIAEIKQEFGFDDVATEVQEEKKIKFFGISTTRAVWAMLISVIVISGIYYALSLLELESNPANDGALRMFNTAKPRILTSMIFWVISVLSSISFIYFLMPDIWKWFHNKIESNFSFKLDFESCTPYERMFLFTLNLWLPAFLFALCLLVILG